MPSPPLPLGRVIVIDRYMSGPLEVLQRVEKTVFFFSVHFSGSNSDGYTRLHLKISSPSEVLSFNPTFCEEKT